MSVPVPVSILYVDDDEDNRQAFGWLFRSAGLVAQFQQGFLYDWLHWHRTISVGFCFREINGVEVKIYVRPTKL